MFGRNKQKERTRRTLGDEIVNQGNVSGVPTTNKVGKQIQGIQNMVNKMKDEIKGESGTAGEEMRKRLEGVNKTLDDFVSFRLRLEKVEDDFHAISKLIRNLESDVKRLNNKYREGRYRQFKEDHERLMQQINDSVLDDEQKQEVLNRVQEIMGTVDTKNRAFGEGGVEAGPKDFEKKRRFFNFFGGKKSRKQRRKQTRKNRRNRRTRRNRA